MPFSILLESATLHVTPVAIHEAHFNTVFFVSTLGILIALASVVRLRRPLSLQVQRRLTCNGLTIRILCGHFTMLTVVVVLLAAATVVVVVVAVAVLLLLFVVVVLFVVVAVIVVACQLANCKLRLACLHMK